MIRIVGSKGVNSSSKKSSKSSVSTRGKRSSKSSKSSGSNIGSKSNKSSKSNNHKSKKSNRGNKNNKGNKSNKNSRNNRSKKEASQRSSVKNKKSKGKDKTSVVKSSKRASKSRESLKSNKKKVSGTLSKSSKSSKSGKSNKSNWSGKSIKANKLGKLNKSKRSNNQNNRDNRNNKSNQSKSHKRVSSHMVNLKKGARVSSSVKSNNKEGKSKKSNSKSSNSRNNKIKSPIKRQSQSQKRSNNKIKSESKIKINRKNNSKTKSKGRSKSVSNSSKSSNIKSKNTDIKNSNINSKSSSLSDNRSKRNGRKSNNSKRIARNNKKNDNQKKNTEEYKDTNNNKKMNKNKKVNKKNNKGKSINKKVSIVANANSRRNSTDFIASNNTHDNSYQNSKSKNHFNDDSSDDASKDVFDKNDKKLMNDSKVMHDSMNETNDNEINKDIRDENMVKKDVNVRTSVPGKPEAGQNVFDEGNNDELSERKLKRFADMIERVKQEISKIVVGQREMIKFTIISLMCDGNALLEGVPGLAKSLTVETLAKTISGATFNRIQFVPDMLPADIIGVNAYNPKTGEFYIVKGPIFANFILADEINRAPPKTQAAMMEAMQEKKVNIHNKEFKFARPFMVLATQNPLEQYGTYPLPEAVVDRFFVKLILDYPKRDEEMKIITQNTLTKFNELNVVNHVISPQEIIEIQDAVRKVYISEEVKKYIIDLIFTTRGQGAQIKGLKYIKYGGSPRATIWLSLGAKAVAIMNGRDYVIPDDVREVIHPILRHRILLNYEGKAMGVNTDDIIDSLIEGVEVP